MWAQVPLDRPALPTDAKVQVEALRHDRTVSRKLTALNSFRVAKAQRQKAQPVRHVLEKTENTPFHTLRNLNLSPLASNALKHRPELS